MEYTKEQQKEHRKELVRALRSGDYTQVKQRLHTDDGYCCLGVACDISGLGEWVTNTHDQHGQKSYIYKVADDDWGDVGLPLAVRQYYGIGEFGDEIRPDGTVTMRVDRREALYQLNDEVGYNFHQIAHTIEGGKGTYYHE